MRDTRVNIGAENMYHETFGAYTGEISAPMLVDAGVKYVILGHSERRAMGETDADINKKLIAALEAGLAPILCLVLDMNSVKWFNGYHFSYELLLMNAAFTIVGLLLISKKK
jgi:triosephosphate isomerase